MNVLAQFDSLSGGSGWAGAGILGLVLLWLLLRHLPEKDKQLTDLNNANNIRIDSQRQEFTKTLTEMMGSFKQESQAERMACEKHFSTLAESMNKAFVTLGEQFSAHSQRNQQWLEVLKSQIDQEMRK